MFRVVPELPLDRVYNLIERARQIGYHSIIGGASAEQTASIALQEKFGFQRVAYIPEVATKFGVRLDLIYLQLMLSPGESKST